MKGKIMLLYSSDRQFMSGELIKNFSELGLLSKEKDFAGLYISSHQSDEKVIRKILG